MVAHSMRDPDSVKLSDLHENTVAGHTYLCGQVNAKNGYGGYVGQRLFVIGSHWQSPRVAGGTPEELLLFLKTEWSRYCVK